MNIRKTIATTAALALAGVLLTGCQSANPGTLDETKKVNSQAEESKMTDLMLHDGWAKAGSGMTAVFGTLMNHTSKTVKLTGATSDLAGEVELHQTDKTTGKMSPVDGGLEVPAGGSLTLAPGGYHIMLMHMTGELKAGDELPITLEFSDGSKLEVKVLAKDYAGAQENYGESESGEAGAGAESEHSESSENSENSDHSDHDMSNM